MISEPYVHEFTLIRVERLLPFFRKPLKYTIKNFLYGLFSEVAAVTDFSFTVFWLISKRVWKVKDVLPSHWCICHGEWVMPLTFTAFYWCRTVISLHKINNFHLIGLSGVHIISYIHSLHIGLKETFICFCWRSFSKSRCIALVVITLSILLMYRRSLIRCLSRNIHFWEGVLCIQCNVIV